MSKTELDKGDSLYGVLALKDNLRVEVSGVKTKLDLIWCSGQVGAMPVFKEYEDALSYTNGEKNRIFELEITAV